MKSGTRHKQKRIALRGECGGVRAISSQCLQPVGTSELLLDCAEWITDSGGAAYYENTVSLPPDRDPKVMNCRICGLKNRKRNIANPPLLPVNTFFCHHPQVNKFGSCYSDQGMMLVLKLY